MAENMVLSAIDERGVATLTRNRPEAHNAYDGPMIDATVEEVGRSPPIRACACWCCRPAQSTASM